MDTRIGYPNEYLAGNSSADLSSPVYATAVGLVMNSLKNNTKSATPIYKFDIKGEKVAIEEPVASVPEPQEVVTELEEKPKPEAEGDSKKIIRKNFFDKYIEKIKEFLENAE